MCGRSYHVWYTSERRLSPSSYWDENMSLGPLVRPHEIQRSIGQFLLSGVLERFPGLKIVSAENGTDWLPWFVRRIERLRQNTSYPTKLSMKPIEYFHRQVYFTYLNDPDTVEARELIGLDNLMFATDYPHSASSWPRSQEIVASHMQSVPDDHHRKLINENARRLFNVPALVPA